MIRSSSYLGSGVGFLVCCMLWGLPVVAQNTKTRTDSINLVVKELRTAIVKADSSQNNEQAMSLRVELARSVSGPEAIKLLEQAAITANYLADRKEELEIRIALAEQYRSAGKSLPAFNEMVRIQSLMEERDKKVKDENERQRILTRTNYEYKVDSLRSVIGAERSEAERKMAESEARADRWQWLAIGFGLLWLFSSIFLFHRSGKAQKRSVVAIAELRDEIEIVKRSGSVKVQMPTVTRDEVPEIKVPEVLEEEPEPLDPVLVAMFRKMAPERLATLKDARSRQDDEKVIRVVHSLRPQMMGLDPVRSAPLYAKIKAKNSDTDPVGWNALLDEFRTDVETLLERTAH